MTPFDPLAVACIIGNHLDTLGIRYVVGGSVASSFLGEPRSTLDLDIMIEGDVYKVRELVGVLSDSCYVDEATAVRAVEEGRSFNAIHLASAMKIDFFIAEPADFAEEALVHRRRVGIPGVGSLYLYATEDLVVRKLLWFRLGGETSERQWRDVVSLLRINGADSDITRMRRLAQEVKVHDLLERALVDEQELR